MEESADRIGSLPDGVLCHILSFLPTKTAVSTAILSTRWRYLFPFSNNLHFDESLVLNSQGNDQSLDDRMGRFLDFVDQCIMRMNVTLVDKFCFKCDSAIDPSRVNSWIGSAPLQNVRELDLCIPTTRELGMKPLRVFSCNTLVVLKLGTDFSLDVPSSIYLPCLKNLHLQSISFKDDISTQRLFSSCPVIEDLVIEGCFLGNISVLNLSSPSLKRLTLGKAKFMLFYFKLVFDAPNLVYLNYTICSREGGYMLKNLHSLSEAHISFGDLFSYNGQTALAELFEGISSVQSLYIYFSHRELPLEWDGLPLLENLTCLVLKCTPFITLSLVMKLLRCTPNLEEFIFDGGIRQDTHEDGCIDLPSCVSSRLKAINFNLLQDTMPGIEKDMKSLEYFLKNANILERMYICITCSSFQKEAATKVMETFKKIGRSKKCEIKLFPKVLHPRVERLLRERELRMSNRHRSVHSIDDASDGYLEHWLFNEEGY